MPPVPAQAAAGCNTTTPDLSVTVTCVTPGTETIVVPAGASQANVVVIGGGGGSGGAGSGRNSGAGGNAAVVTATLEIIAPTLSIRVASGGERDNSNARGAAGGGYSLIGQSVSGTVTPMVIAGGGGGGSAGLSLSDGDGGSGGSAAVGGLATGGAGGSGPGRGNFPGGLGGSGGVGGFASEYSNAGSDWALGGSGAAPKSYAGGGGSGFGGGASGASSDSALEGASGGGAGGSFADPSYTTSVAYSTADRSGSAPFHGAGGLSVINEVGRAGFVGKVEITFLAPPPGVPSAPIIFLAGAGDGQASVTWLTPESDGGSAILSYTVTASPGFFSCTTPNGSTNTCVVTGLTNGVSYTFTVTARNNLGDGPASAAFGPITPRPAPVAPDAPTEVVAMAGDGLVDVSWVAPANNGGATIEGYQVQVATSATGVYTNAQGGCAPASTDSWSGVKCQATGLVNGQTYFFKVRAQNAVNWGSYSLASSAVTPLAPPIPIPPTPGGGGVPATVEDQTPLQPSLPTPQKSTDSAKEVPSPKPSQGEATNTVVRAYTIGFSSGSARLSAKTKQSLDKIAQQSRLAARATTFASARLTRKGATLANQKLAEQRTRQVCSYLRSVKLKGPCSRKIWILKPGKKSIGPNIVVRMRATARQ